MSLGFEQAGFKIVAAVDVSEINTEIHAANFPNTATICADLRKVKGSAIRREAKLGKTVIDVVFGGPPCQGFSIGGKQKADDPRNGLLLEFARLVVELRPRYFVMENVGGLLLERYEPLLKKFKASLKKGGYTVVEPIARLDAANYGVPQRRKRVFVLGCRTGERYVSYPTPLKGRVSVNDAIADLKPIDEVATLSGDAYSGRLGRPSEYARELRQRRHRRGKSARKLTGVARTSHAPEIEKRFEATAPGSAEPVSRFIRLARDGVAPTLRAGTGADKGRFMAPRPIHPEIPRCISVREAARLHSFPDWFVFHGTKWNGFMQIGNSVPPKFAQAVAEEVRRSLRGE